MKKRKWYWWLGLAIIVGHAFNLPWVVDVVLGRGTPEQVAGSIGVFVGLGIGVWLMYKGRRRMRSSTPTTLGK